MILISEKSFYGVFEVLEVHENVRKSQKIAYPPFLEIWIFQNVSWRETRFKFSKWPEKAVLANLKRIFLHENRLPGIYFFDIRIPRTQIRLVNI